MKKAEKSASRVEKSKSELEEIEKSLRPKFEEIEQVAFFNQKKVLDAFRKLASLRRTLPAQRAMATPTVAVMILQDWWQKFSVPRMRYAPRI